MQSSLTEPRSAAPGPGGPQPQVGPPLKVDLVESLGAESFVYGRPLDAGEGADRVTVRLDKRTHLTVGDVVHVQPTHSEVHVFDAASGERIGA